MVSKWAATPIEVRCGRGLAPSAPAEKPADNGAQKQAWQRQKDQELGIVSASPTWVTANGEWWSVFALGGRRLEGQRDAVHAIA